MFKLLAFSGLVCGLFWSNKRTFETVIFSSSWHVFFRDLYSTIAFPKTKNKIMKKTLLSISAYLLSILLGLSFFFMLFSLLKFNYFIGFTLVALLVLTTVFLILDPDFIQESEEYWVVKKSFLFIFQKSLLFI